MGYIHRPVEVLAEDVAGQKGQRTERLILRRGAHTPVNRQSREKPRDLVLAHLQGMALPWNRINHLIQLTYAASVRIL